MRALRRHHKERAYKRRRRILTQGWHPYDEEDIANSKIMNWHINCNCMGVKDYKKAEDKKREKEDKKVEEVAY